MRDKWLVIFNPFANQGVAMSHKDPIHRLLVEHGFNCDWRSTDYRGHAASIMINGLIKGYRKFLTAGGDGTLHEVINGIMSQDLCLPEDIDLAHIPLGAVNDWSLYKKIPLFYKNWIPKIKDAPLQPNDIGILRYKANEEPKEKFFFSIAGFALPALVIKNMFDTYESSASKKEMINILINLAFRFPKYDLEIITDNAETQERFSHVHVTFCNEIAGYKMTNLERSPGSMLVIRDTGNYTRRSLLYDVIFNFLLNKFPKSKYNHSSESKVVYIKSMDGVETNHIYADGEYIGSGDCQLSVHPQPFYIRLPEVY